MRNPFMYYFYAVHYDHLGLADFCFYSIFTENIILAFLESLIL